VRVEPGVGGGWERESRPQDEVEQRRHRHRPGQNRVHEWRDRVRCPRTECPATKQLSRRGLPGSRRENPRCGLLPAVQLPRRGCGAEDPRRPKYPPPERRLAGSSEGEAGTVREAYRARAGWGRVVSCADRGREAEGE